MYTLINGSSKIVPSNSFYFLNYISKDLEQFKIVSLKNDNYKDIINSVEKSRVLVLAFPLYVDSPNTWTLKFLDYIFDKKMNLNNKKLYVIINCGFKEGEHNLTALNIIKAWCERVNIDYYGALLIGAGEVVGDKKYRFLSNSVHKYLNKLSKSIKREEIFNDTITTMDLLTNKMYCKIANIFWTKSAKKNGLIKKNILEE